MARTITFSLMRYGRKTGETTDSRRFLYGYSIWVTLPLARSGPTFQSKRGWVNVCAHFFYPPTSSTASARADSSILLLMLIKERYKFCGHKTTPHQRYDVATYGVSTAAVNNAMPCHDTGYDRHNIHILWIRDDECEFIYTLIIFRLFY